MGKKIFKDCEYCYVKDIKYLSNLNHGDKFICHIIITFELLDEDKNKLPMKNSISVIKLNPTVKKITAVELINLPEKKKTIILKEIKRLKKKYANFDLTI